MLTSAQTDYLIPHFR